MSHSVHADNKTRSFLVLGEGFTHRLDKQKFMLKNCIQLFLVKIGKNLQMLGLLSLHYNRTDSYLFVNGKEIYRFKAKDSEIAETPICLGKISKDFSMIYILLTGLKGYVYDFSVDYRALAADKILDIHKYLMEKSNIKRGLD